jgi:translation elongation factor P/translation initiation factor 5A
LILQGRDLTAGDVQCREENFMIAPNEVEKGLALDIEGEPHLVLERQLVNEAGIAKIRSKLRQLRT